MAGVSHLEQSMADTSSDWSPRQPIKSTAIVKYSTVQSPANFARLQCNTDLNLPPSNWLTSSAESYGLQHVLPNSTGFSSFRMAHMFPDCAGKVDVVSDAENIKKLLKIPYSRAPVSMMVHRVGNTLLIDEFDIQRHLLRTAESDWEWLRKFFLEHVLQSLGDKEKSIQHKNKSRYALQQKSLVSKFLHHSLAEPTESTVSEAETDSAAAAEGIPLHLPLATNYPWLPEPPSEEEQPGTPSDHKFNRNVVWTFEDIQMLLGTDMPIFGGDTHPCISLRLRNMAKPISVLTGLDYWLDNLMCNVPEVAMCFHLDGIVQRYELVNTEDLPHLHGSRFSPKLIRDVAQNVLAFLKANATKAGHTYWLFKGKDEDVVKLYDLSSLCSEGLVEKGQNPFTVPVAMLLYRVARNMKHSPEDRSNTQPGTIRMLLKNCLALLPEEKYPQIVTSTHYMLSDLYVPVGTDPASPELPDEPQQEEPEREDEDEVVEEEERGHCSEMDVLLSNSVPVQSLCIAGHQTNNRGVPNHAPPLVGSIEERCKMALEHVITGLQCLQFIDCGNNNDCCEGGGGESSKGEQEEVPVMAKPSQAIPMPYSPLEEQPIHGGKRKTRRRKKVAEKVKPANEQWEDLSMPRTLLCKTRAEAMPTWQQPDLTDNAAWKTHLRILLYEKACLVYATLSEHEYAMDRYASALRHIGGTLRCLPLIADDLSASSGMASYLLGRAGDCCLKLAQDWAHIAAHRNAYEESNPNSLEALLAKDLPPASSSYSDANCLLIPTSLEGVEPLLKASCSLYERALSLQPSDNLHRRLGNIRNELATLYMNQVASEFIVTLHSDQSNQPLLERLLKLAQDSLVRGIKEFELVGDRPNQALLHSNQGRFMRLRAHMHSSEHPVPVQSTYYNKALASYQTALTKLGSREANKDIWDTVMWEKSTCLYTIATLSQDFPDDSKDPDEAEAEEIKLLLTALRVCDTETDPVRLRDYQFRAADLHHRIASLYFCSYRRQVGVEESNRNTVLALCQLNYEYASRLFLLLAESNYFLHVQLERIAVAEFFAENVTDMTGQVKNYQLALEFLMHCRKLPELKEVKKNEISRDPTKQQAKGSTKNKSHLNSKKCEFIEELRLMALIEKRFQFLLRTLTKLCLKNPIPKLASLGPVYKEAYARLLKREPKTTILKHVLDVIEYLTVMRDST